MIRFDERPHEPARAHTHTHTRTHPHLPPQQQRQHTRRHPLPPPLLPSLRSCLDLSLELPVSLTQDGATITPVFLGGSPRDRLWLLQVAAADGVRAMESGLLCVRCRWLAVAVCCCCCCCCCRRRRRRRRAPVPTLYQPLSHPLLFERGREQSEQPSRSKREDWRAHRLLRT